MTMPLKTFAFTTLLLLGSPSFATSLKTPIQNKGERKVALDLHGGYTQADNTNAGVTFYEFGAGVNFTLSEKFSVSAEVSQGLLTSNFGTGFTALGFGLDYLISGSNTLDTQKVTLENYKVFDMKGRPSPSLSVSLDARQVFFNGSSQVYPYTGMGACVKYRPFQSATGYWGGDLCYDYLLNPPNSTTMIRAMLGWSVFLF